MNSTNPLPQIYINFIIIIYIILYNIITTTFLYILTSGSLLNIKSNNIHIFFSFLNIAKYILRPKIIHTPFIFSFLLFDK